MFAGNRFPNCVETALMVIALLKARVCTNAGYAFDSTQFMDGPLKTFTATYATEPENLFSEETHNACALMMSGLQGIKYLRTNTKTQQSYEVKPGFLNCLRVLGNLSPEFHELTKVSSSNGFEGLKSCLSLLSKILSHDGYNIEMKPQYHIMYLSKEDFFEDENIIISINGTEKLIWNMHELHTCIKAIYDPTIDWRKKVEAKVIAEGSYLEMLPHFLLPAHTMELLFSLKDPQQQKNFVYSLDLRNLEIKMSLFEAIYKNNVNTLEPLALSLAQDIERLHDGPASDHIVKVLTSGFLRSDQITQVLQIAPFACVLSSNIEGNSLFKYYLARKESGYISLLLPYVLDLCYDTDLLWIAQEAAESFRGEIVYFGNGRPAGVKDETFSSNKEIVPTWNSFLEFLRVQKQLGSPCSIRSINVHGCCSSDDLDCLFHALPTFSSLYLPTTSIEPEILTSKLIGLFRQQPFSGSQHYVTIYINNNPKLANTHIQKICDTVQIATDQLHQL